MPELMDVPVIEAGQGSVTATIDGEPVGRLTFHTVGDDGAAQLLHVEVDPRFRRSGLGTLLLKRAFTAAADELHGEPLRRFWCMARHERDVVLRAWLGQRGFHHVATVPDLAGDEDGLVYVRTFD